MRKTLISVLLITKNNEEIIEKTARSLVGFDDVVVVDGGSTDKTLFILKKILPQAKIFVKEFFDIGKQRRYGLRFCRGKWVLILDSDEVLSSSLKKEIFQKIQKTKFNAFFIPYQNHFLGKKINFGGENYSMLRLFRKDSLLIKPSTVHNIFILKKGKASFLKNKIFHYSYRSIFQVFKKFKDYAQKMARIKFEKKEEVNLKKLTLYPLHMFYARFIKDKGYRDGLMRVFLDIAFAFMEFWMYFKLYLLKIKKTDKI